MRDPRGCVVAVVSLAVLAGVAPAQLGAQVDFSGTWRIDLQAFEPELDPASAAPVLGMKQAAPCVYTGSVELAQAGSEVSGPVEVSLILGPETCPAEMSGSLGGSISSGDVVGSLMISGMIDGSDPSGVTTFSGTLSPNPGGAGDFAVTQGDFVGTSGSWMARLQQSIFEIPGLGPLGLALLTALLLAAGAWILARSQPA